MKKTTDQLVYGDLVRDTLDGGKYRRFVRHEGSAVVLMDRDTLKELPDYRHPSQIEVA